MKKRIPSGAKKYISSVMGIRMQQITPKVLRAEILERLTTLSSVGMREAIKAIKNIQRKQLLKVYLRESTHENS